MTQTIYTIPDRNMPGLMHKLAGLSRKSKKLIGKDINFKILREVRTPRTRPYFDGRMLPVRDHEGNQVFDLFYEVTIQCDVPKINGWSFVATIDHSSDSGNIVRVSPNADFTAPEIYRTIRPKCDHCQKIRGRNDTFLLRCDATGDVKQIGSKCLRDFIGHDIKSVLAMAQIIYQSIPSDHDGEEDWTGGIGKNQKYIYVRTFVAHTSAVIRHDGWMPKKQAEIKQEMSTADAVHQNMFRRPDGKWKPYDVTSKDIEIADAALTWGASLATSRDDYLYNLSVVARDVLVANRSIGILASLISAYMRHINQRIEQPNALDLTASRHFGSQGARVTISATLYAYKPTAGGQWGPTHIYRFLTDEGNVVVWFASDRAAQSLDLGILEAKQRVLVKLTGTIVNHQAHEHIQQTVMNRCKIEKVAS